MILSPLIHHLSNKQEELPMENGEMEYLEAFEADVKAIRDAALEKARLTDPKIPFVIDSRPMEEYCSKTWDYPGKWYYAGLKLPNGFSSKEELIDAIAEETIRYFSKKR